MLLMCSSLDKQWSAALVGFWRCLRIFSGYFFLKGRGLCNAHIKWGVLLLVQLVPPVLLEICLESCTKGRGYSILSSLFSKIYTHAANEIEYSTWIIILSVLNCLRLRRREKVKEQLVLYFFWRADCLCDASRQKYRSVQSSLYWRSFEKGNLLFLYIMCNWFECPSKYGCSRYPFNRV